MRGSNIFPDAVIVSACCPLRVACRFAHVHGPLPDELKRRFLIERKWNGSLIHVQDIILMATWIGNLGTGDHDEITGFTFHFGRCTLLYMCTHPVHQSVNLDEMPHDIILCRTTLLTEITTDLGGFQQNNGVCNSNACFTQLEDKREKTISVWLQHSWHARMKTSCLLIGCCFETA